MGIDPLHLWKSYNDSFLTQMAEYVQILLCLSDDYASLLRAPGQWAWCCYTILIVVTSEYCLLHRSLLQSWLKSCMCGDQPDFPNINQTFTLQRRERLCGHVGIVHINFAHNCSHTLPYAVHVWWKFILGGWKYETSIGQAFKRSVIRSYNLG